MNIEYRIRFEAGGVTINQSIDPRLQGASGFEVSDPAVSSGRGQDVSVELGESHTRSSPAGTGRELGGGEGGKADTGGNAPQGTPVVIVFGPVIFLGPTSSDSGSGEGGKAGTEG